MPRKKVLIYLLGSLGDTLVAIPALRAVRRHFEDADFFLLHNVQAEHIVNSAQVLPDGMIDGFIQYRKGESKLGSMLALFHLRRDIRRHGFTAVVNLVDSERPAASVRRDEFFFKTCGIPSRVGFSIFSREELYPTDERGWPALTDHEAVRKLRRLERAGVQTRSNDLELPYLHIPDEAKAEAIRFLTTRGVDDWPNLVTIAPSCKQKSNQWTPARFVELARFLRGKGFQLVVLGGPADRENAASIASSTGAIDAAGALSVLQSATIMSLARFHIGLDTGPTHLASAVGARCFVIYGQRVNPGQWYPLGSGHMLTAHPVPCGGCRHEVCPVPGHPCVVEISTQDVLTNLERFLAEVDAPPRSTVTVINV
jgi:heptosyltransferase III